MRRGLSISLILLFWLGPVTAALGNLDESRLPACCRRHGRHHCAMSAEGAAAAMEDSGPAIAAPAHCPYLPQRVAALTAPAAAPGSSAASLPVAVEEICQPSHGQATAHLEPMGVRAVRGPPASIFG